MAVLWRPIRQDEEMFATHPPLVEFLYDGATLRVRAPSKATAILRAYGGSVSWDAGVMPQGAFAKPTPRLAARLIHDLGAAGFGPIKVSSGAWKLLQEQEEV